MTGRRGFTLTELMVGLVIVGIIGGALTRLLVSQSRFYDQQTQLRRARFLSRTAVNAALSDLRMTEATGGVVAATPTSVTLRVPYALGIVCASSAAQATVALFPVDSTVYATSGFSGYAWRDTLGAYTYVEGSVALGAGATATCTGANVTVLTGGRAVTVAPGLPTALAAVVTVGTPVLVFQRLRYEFKASAALPGQVGLWRTVVATGLTDELVAPFDTTAVFRFLVAGSITAQAAVPNPLTNLRGLELHFDALSDRAPAGSAKPKRAQLVTAVFFNNSLK
jgi:prepilin-type N-terminal cleavage/methylation domain-containing protein